MKVFKWGLVLIGGLLLGAIGWFLGASLFGDKPASQAVYTNDSNRIMKLQQEISDMKKNIAKLRAKQTSFTQRNITYGSAETLSQNALITNNRTEIPLDTTGSQKEALNASDKATEDAPSIIALPEKFVSEEVNTQWALDHEKKLKEILYKDINFQAKGLGSITCKSTICEIKIAVDKKEELMKIGSDLNRLLMLKQPNVFDPNMMIKYSASEKAGHFYFGAVN